MNSHLASQMATRVPERLVGIWTRQSVELSGRPALPRGAFERARVVWFQAPTRYADLRLPFADPLPLCAEEAFGGAVRWAEPQLYFDHAIDRAGGIRDDVGEIRFDAGILFESGTFEFEGYTCSYVERWQRASARGAHVEVFEHFEGDRLDGLCIHIADETLLLRETDRTVSAAHHRGRTLLRAVGDPGEAPRSADEGWRCVDD